MKFKKSLLALGTAATIVAPIATVVSCGSTEQKVRHFGLLPTYTGQADQLIALGIHADYYPEQLNVQAPYDYLTNPGQYMTQQTDEFKAKFTKAVAGLMPKTKGVSWWNQDAKNSDDNRISNTYWQKQEGSVLLYEHYLLDDDQKVVTSAWAPKHQPQTAIQTNFRASRDPYTRIPKGVFFGWDLSNKSLEDIAEDGKATTVTLVDEKTHNEKVYSATEAGVADATAKPAFTIASGVVTSTLNGANVEITQDSAKIIIAMRKKRAELLNDSKGESDWFYNDWFFVDSFHRTYLDNDDFQKSKFAQWMLDSTEANPFEAVAAKGHVLKDDQANIKALFDASTFQGDEVKAGLAPSSRALEDTSTTSAHHPIYEQQEGEIGAAPMFEGAMRDNQLYLFNVAWQVANLAKTGTPYGKAFVESLPEHTPATASKNAADFSVARSVDEANAIKDYVASQVTPTQLAEMKAALVNANTITDQLHTRMESMKKYFAALGVNGKTFGLMTVAPGHGVSTLQTTSKFSFIYNELGFAQPTPSNLGALAASAREMSGAWHSDGTNDYLTDGKVNSKDAGVTEAIGAGSLFNMDDNGWFWTLGESGKLDADRLDKFSKSIDLGVIASRPENFKAEVTANSGIQKHLAEMFTSYDVSKDTDGSKFVAKLREHANYDLWNEGLKTPFVMDMLLDQIMTKSEEYYLAQPGKNEASLKALQTTANGYDGSKSWGDYFTNTFTKDVK